MSETIQLAATGVPVRNTPRHVRGTAAHHNIRKLSIIIPCYNEASTIAIILDKVTEVPLMHGIEKEIIVINDCSIDDTDIMVKEYMADYPEAPIQYYCHPVNKGKGAAVHKGIAVATGDYLLIQDADLEYDPKEYNLLLGPILAGHADIVYGSRFMGGNAHRILFFWHTWGNKMLTFISNALTNMNLTDAHTCYKLMRTEMIREIPLLEKRFAFDAELNIKISKLRKVRIYEVGISYYGRTFSEGKKIRMRDAFRSIWCLIRYSFSSGKYARLPQQQMA
jgi:glycosyltransferase involved in cell wall biosynthesis